MTEKEFIREVITKSKSLLQKNDLESMYEVALEVQCEDEWLSGEVIGGLTYFIQQHGIDPLKYLKNEIPACCFCSVEGPAKNNALYIPSNIRIIRDIK